MILTCNPSTKNSLPATILKSQLKQAQQIVITVKSLLSNF